MKLLLIGNIPLREMPQMIKMCGIFEDILIPCCCDLLWIEGYYFIKRKIENRQQDFNFLLPVSVLPYTCNRNFWKCLLF